MLNRNKNIFHMQKLFCIAFSTLHTLLTHCKISIFRFISLISIDLCCISSRKIVETKEQLNQLVVDHEIPIISSLKYMI